MNKDTQIVWLPVDSLIPYEHNAKEHTPTQIDNIKKSLTDYGWQNPCLITKDNVLIAGHGRVMAAKELGITEAPCIYADDLTEEQIKEYRHLDNLLSEGGYIESELKYELQTVDLSGYDFSEINTEIQGINLPIEADEPGEVVEDDIPEVNEAAEPICKLGDIWVLGNHRLICGDSTDGAVIDRLIDGEFMRMTVTSPPYGVGKDYEVKGIKPWFQTIQGVINAIKGKTLIICWNIGDLYSTGTQFTEPTGAYSIQMMDAAGYGMLYNRIWKKPGGNFACNNPYYTVTTKPVQEYEYLFAFAEKKAERHIDPIKEYLFCEARKAKLNNDIIASEGGPKHMYGHWFTNHQWTFIDKKNYELIQNYCNKNNVNAFFREYESLSDEYKRCTIFSHCLSDDEFSQWGLYGVWDFNTVTQRLGGHAAAFPVELPTRYIKVHSYEGDNVLDPFGGTGTTLIACEQLNRKCYMVELDPKYCDVIIQRWENFTGQKAVKL